MSSRAISYYGPKTRIRRRGLAAYRNSRMRRFFKRSALYLLPFFFFALAYVWTRVQVIETGYQIRRLEELQEKLKEENRASLVEVATLRSSQRLEKMAVALGLQRPSEQQIYFIQRERVADRQR